MLLPLRIQKLKGFQLQGAVPLDPAGGSAPHLIHGSFDPPEAAPKRHLDRLNPFGRRPDTILPDKRTNIGLLSYSLRHRRHERTPTTKRDSRNFFERLGGYYLKTCTRPNAAYGCVLSASFLILKRR